MDIVPGGTRTTVMDKVAFQETRTLLVPGEPEHRNAPMMEQGW